MGSENPCCNLKQNQRKQPPSHRNHRPSKISIDNLHLDIDNDNYSGNVIKTESKISNPGENDIITIKCNQKIECEKLDFPLGEHYYQLIKDCNRTELIKKEDNLSEKVEIFFSLTHVKNQNDEHSFEISIINNTRTGIITYLGKLENRKGKEIEFGKFFQVDFFFEREQKIIIKTIINNNIIENKKKEFILCKLMTTSDNKLSIEIEDIGILEIKNKKKEKQNKELDDETSIFQFSIKLNNDKNDNNDNNDIFNKEERLKGIYFVIRNIKDGTKKRPVYKSHEYDLKLNEKKKSSFISLDSNILCNNDDSPIFFELYAPQINKTEFIGDCFFNIKQLKSNLEKDKLEQIEIRNKDNEKLGTLEINYSCSKIISFDHYIKNGQINLDIAIDYTKSNGFPSDPKSLHYIKAEGGNDYEKAIKSCGKIIAYYDYDNLFPVYGFGGILPNSNNASHCFNINFNDDNPEIQTLENVIKYYKESLKKVRFYGPTFFSPVIKKVMEDINEELENKKEENHYHILLILTDGIITDMDKTVDCIVEASKLPLSIVIIGIGKTDFENMKFLDGDIIPLVNSSGEIRKRDIVQFAEFNTFKEKNAINDGKELAEEVLKEIPRQIEEYYKFCGKFYEPNNKIS